MKISNTKNTYKKVCLSDSFSIHHKTWFFDTVRIWFFDADRTWFFDMIGWQGKINFKHSSRVTKIKGTTESKVISLKMSVASLWTPQTIDD